MAGPATPFPDFTISRLALAMPTTQTSNCGHVSNLLAPLSDGEISAANPAMADIGLLALLGLVDHDGLPPPLDRATAGELARWWRGALETDRGEATALLKRLAGACMRDACTSTTGIGEADIAGIGVTVANAMLAVLVVAFWFFGLAHTAGPAHRGDWGHVCRGEEDGGAGGSGGPGRPMRPASGSGPGSGSEKDSGVDTRCIIIPRICGAMRATIDDVFDGALVFSISLHVATLSYQAQARGGGDDNTRYEVTFAQSSCTFAALSVMTLWHIRSELVRPRLYARLFFVAMSCLALAVFVMRALYWLYPTTFWDQACVPPASEAWWHGRELFDFLSAAYFGLALLATFLPLDPLFSRWFPQRAARKGEYARRGMISKLRFTQSFFGAGGIFVYMIVLNQARSNFEDENTWSIGQYLAVATWVPSIAKLLYFLCAGMEESLTDYLPLPWVAALPPMQAVGDSGVNPLEERGNRGVEETGPSEQEEGIVSTSLSDTIHASTTGTSGTGLLQRRDSDITVVGDAPESVKSLTEPERG